jgi:hypothetical protein
LEVRTKEHQEKEGRRDNSEVVTQGHLTTVTELQQKKLNKAETERGK